MSFTCVTSITCNSSSDEDAKSTLSHTESFFSFVVFSFILTESLISLTASKFLPSFLGGSFLLLEFTLLLLDRTDFASFCLLDLVAFISCVACGGGEPGGGGGGESGGGGGGGGSSSGSGGIDGNSATSEE